MIVIPTKVGDLLLDDEQEFFLNKTIHIDSHGYAQIKIKKTKYLVHHLVIGRPPTGMVTDHINRNKLDNRKENLRHCSQQENCINSSHIVMWTIFGETKYQSEWIRDPRCVVEPSTFIARVDRLNWSPELALTTPANTRTRYTESEDDKIIMYIKNGKKVEEIAIDLGRTITSVYNRCSILRKQNKLKK